MQGVCMKDKGRHRRSGLPGAVPWEIVTRMERAPDSETVKARLVETAASFGFSSLFAGWVPPPQPHLKAEAVAEKVVVSTMPDPWQSRYFDRGYVFRDPIVQRLKNEHLPFTWDEAYQTCPDRRDVHVIRGEASEFGLRDGFVVPIALLGGLQLAFSFGAAAFDVDPEALSTLAFATNIAAGRIIDLAMPPSIRSATQTPITGRERDSLSWAAEGKTDWEIATIMGISVPTVRKHLASVRDKLDALNKFHAVAKGIRTGLLK